MPAQLHHRCPRSQVLTDPSGIYVDLRRRLCSASTTSSITQLRLFFLLWKSPATEVCTLEQHFAYEHTNLCIQIRPHCQYVVLARRLRKQLRHSKIQAIQAEIMSLTATAPAGEILVSVSRRRSFGRLGCKTWKNFCMLVTSKSRFKRCRVLWSSKLHSEGSLSGKPSAWMEFRLNFADSRHVTLPDYRTL